MSVLIDVNMLNQLMNIFVDIVGTLEKSDYPQSLFLSNPLISSTDVFLLYWT